MLAVVKSISTSGLSLFWEKDVVRNVAIAVMLLLQSFQQKTVSSVGKGRVVASISYNVLWAILVIF